MSDDIFDEISKITMIPIRILFGQYTVNTISHAELDAYYHQMNDTATWSFMQTWVESLGGELMPCHAFAGAIDVIGVAKWKQFLIDEMRPVGVLVRHFVSHEARLNEFQSRLDAARVVLQKRASRS